MKAPRSFSLIASALVASVVLASATTAHAQTYVPPPPPQIVYVSPLVPLSLEGDTPGMHYEVIGPKGDNRVYAHCVVPCTVQLPAGSYRVRVKGESMPSKTSPIMLEGSTRIYTEAGSSSGRYGGLAVAIAGTSAAAVGLSLLALKTVMEDHRSSDRDGADSTLMTIGVIASAAGAVLGTAGWVAFASNRTSMHVESGYGPRISFGITPTVGGAAFGLGGTF